MECDWRGRTQPVRDPFKQVAEDCKNLAAPSCQGLTREPLLHSTLWPIDRDPGKRKEDSLWKNAGHKSINAISSMPSQACAARSHVRPFDVVFWNTLCHQTTPNILASEVPSQSLLSGLSG